MRPHRDACKHVLYCRQANTYKLTHGSLHTSSGVLGTLQLWYSWRKRESFKVAVERVSAVMMSDAVHRAVP